MYIYIYIIYIYIKYNIYIYFFFFLAKIRFFRVFVLTSTFYVALLLVSITFSTIFFKKTFALFMLCYCVNYSCYLIKTFKFVSSVFFAKSILPDGSSRVLQLALNLYKLTINR